VIAALKVKGVRPIIARTIPPAGASWRRRWARHRHRSRQELPYETWAQHATPGDFDGSRYAQLFNLGPKMRPTVAFECVGVPGVIQQIVDGAPAGARIVVVGVCMETDKIEPFFGILKQVNVQFVLAYTAQEFAEACI